MKYVYIKRRKNYSIDECDCGVGMPVQTLTNTVGVGDVVPAGMAATTGAEQCSSDCIGSGDNFGNVIGAVNTQKPKRKRKIVRRARKKKPSNKK